MAGRVQRSGSFFQLTFSSIIYNNLVKDLSLKPEAVPPPAGEVVNADQGGSR